MDQRAQGLAGRLVAPNGFGPREKIRLRARGGNEFRHDLILLRDLDFFSGGEPARNLGPLFRHLLNAGGFHVGKMPGNSRCRKLRNECTRRAAARLANSPLPALRCRAATRSRTGYAFGGMVGGLRRARRNSA